MNRTEPSDYINGIIRIKGMTNFTSSSRKKTIGSSEIGELLQCKVIPKLQRKDKESNTYPDRIPKTLLKNKLCKPFVSWPTTFGNIYEDTTQRIFQMLFNCEVLNPSVSIKSPIIGPYNSCSADGIATIMLPKKFIEDAFNKSQRLYEPLFTNYKIKFPFIIDNNLFEYWKVDEEQVTIDVLCEFKSTFSRELSDMSPKYVCQVLSGMDVLNLKHGILTETDIKPCYEHQFAFNKQITSKCMQMEWGKKNPIALGCKIFMSLNDNVDFSELQNNFLDYDSPKYRFMQDLKVGIDYKTFDLPIFIKKDNGFQISGFWCDCEEASLFLKYIENRYDTETLEFSMDYFQEITDLYYGLIDEIMCKEDVICHQLWKLMDVRSSYYPKMSGFCNYLKDYSKKVIEFIETNPTVDDIKTFTF